MELLHAQVIGEGKPFIILHGFLGMSDNWGTLGRRFGEEGYEMHLVDQRNHGRSFHSDEFNYESMVEDLKYYLDTNGLDKIILLGHSMGGKTAMQFAVKYPDRVEKLIVADIAPKEYPQHHQSILKGLSSLKFANPDLEIEGISSRGEADKALSEYVAIRPVRQFLLKNLYWKSKGRLALRMNLPALIENIEEIGEGLANEAVYEGETLFISGGRSDYILPEDELLLKKHFPSFKLKRIEGVGHWLHAEKPEEFYDIVMGFL